MGAADSLDAKAEAMYRARGRKSNDEASADEFAAVRTARSIVQTAHGPMMQCVPERVPPGLVIIGARPKARKSWYALQLAIARATPRTFMGKVPTRCRALYLALEDNDRRMKRRLEFFGLTPETTPDGLHIVYDWPKGAAGVAKLARWLALHPDTGLITVDVLQRFRGPRDARLNAYDADYATMGMLQSLAAKHPGLTILVVHHIRKGAVDDPVEAISGSFAIAGAADAYIILKRHDGDRWSAHVDGRDWESWDHDFLWEFRPGEGWVQLGALDQNLTDRQQEIVAMAKGRKSVTPSEIAEHFNVSKQAAHEALRSLVAKDAMYVRSGRYFSTVATVP
jgi:hypothetical protein